jgi:hypothetical protein
MLETKIEQIKVNVDLINEMNKKNPHMALVDLFNFANDINDEGGLTAPKPFLGLNIFITENIKKQENICKVINIHLSKLKRSNLNTDEPAERRDLINSSDDVSTVYNTFIGAVHSLPTHPVSFWLKKDKEPKLEEWVKNFVYNHTNGITKALA